VLFSMSGAALQALVIPQVNFGNLSIFCRRHTWYISPHSSLSFFCRRYFGLSEMTYCPMGETPIPPWLYQLPRFSSCFFLGKEILTPPGLKIGRLSAHMFPVTPTHKSRFLWCLAPGLVFCRFCSFIFPLSWLRSVSLGFVALSGTPYHTPGKR